MLSRGLWFAVMLACLCGPAVAGVEAIARPRLDAELAFTVPGRVMEVLVEPGQRVEEGDPLVVLDHRDSRAQVALLEMRAESDVEIRSAEASLELARNEEASVKDAFEQGGASRFEVRRAELRTKQAELTLEQRRREKEETLIQLHRARIQLEQFTCRATADGVIDQVFVEEGESVQALRAVARLVATDRLWVDANVPAGESLSLRAGGPAWVTFRMPGIDRPVEGTILHMATVADAASGTRRVRVEVPNDLELPAGTRVLVRFEPPDPISRSDR